MLRVWLYFCLYIHLFSRTFHSFNYYFYFIPYITTFWYPENLFTMKSWNKTFNLTKSSSPVFPFKIEVSTYARKMQAVEKNSPIDNLYFSPVYSNYQYTCSKMDIYQVHESYRPFRLGYIWHNGLPAEEFNTGLLTFQIEKMELSESALKW